LAWSASTKTFVRPWLPARVGDNGKPAEKNSPKAYDIRKTSAAGWIVMYTLGSGGGMQVGTEEETSNEEQKNKRGREVGRAR
jgi:hypothetical protein